jgi:aryl-alcohol dehydrogenase-like predicted oxidoreductase
MRDTGKLVLGTAKFGQKYGISNKSQQPEENEISKIIEFARASGMLTLDTAMNYGSSEPILGKLGISDFSSITKLSPLPLHEVDIHSWLEGKIKQSLKNLRVDKLYGLLVHRTNDLIEGRGGDLIDALERIKEEGLVDKIGISAYSPSEVANIHRKFKFNLIQIPLNIFDRRFEESNVLQILKKENVEIHARSIFLQGLLLLPRNEIPAKFNRWVDEWDKYHSFLLKEDVNPIEACLSYPFSLPEIDKVVVGVDSASQLKEIVRFVKSDFKSLDTLELKSDENKLIDASLW